MRSLLQNIRFYILLFSTILAVGIFIWVKITSLDLGLQIFRLTQYYALIAVIFLYLALLTTPLVKLFPKLPFNQKYLKARRAIGVSAFFFGLLHANLAFFWQLGGFNGLGYLNAKSLWAIGLSSTSLFILFLMAATSFDFMIAKLTFSRWKILHRLVYLAAIFIIIHALILGTHFTNLSGLIPRTFFVAISLLFILEALRFDRYLKNKFPALPSAGISVLVVLSGLVWVYFNFYSTTTNHL